jgi:hypothetical protein
VVDPIRFQFFIGNSILDRVWIAIFEMRLELLMNPTGLEHLEGVFSGSHSVRVFLRDSADFIGMDKANICAS